MYLTDNIGQNSCTSGDLVDSEEECLKVAQALMGADASLQVVGSWPGKPKGCETNEGKTKFWYNSHSTGGMNAGLGPVCQRPKTDQE